MAPALLVRSPSVVAGSHDRDCRIENSKDAAVGGLAGSEYRARMVIGG